MKKQISDDEEKHSSHLPEKKKIYSPLHLILALCGLFYLWCVISTPILFDNYNLLDILGNIVAYLAFVLFLIGFYKVWKNERIAGIIFIFWWAVIWFLALLERQAGELVIWGLPVFILGILFIISWYRKKGKETTA